MKKLLDLFCGAGGCTRGYQEAGFYVVGVDINHQTHYVGDDFIQMDALEAMWILIDGGFVVGRSGQRYWLADFAVIHASPPCQVYSITKSLCKKSYPDLVVQIRNVLLACNKPYVIENVPGAPLLNPFMLCGTMFGLRVIRHRIFETNTHIYMSPFSCNHWGRVLGSCGRIKNKRVTQSFEHATFITVVGNDYKVSDGRIAMGIDWMTQRELSQAIPPTYTRWIGEQLMKIITGVDKNV